MRRRWCQGRRAAYRLIIYVCENFRPTVALIGRLVVRAQSNAPGPRQAGAPRSKRVRRRLATRYNVREHVERAHTAFELAASG